MRLRGQLRGMAVGLLAVASLGLSGCPVLLLGAGVAGGYAISEDSVRNQFEMTKPDLYARSRAVAQELGLITAEDSRGGIIRAKVQDANVTITVKTLTRRSTELKVKARNGFMMPEVDVAQAVYNKIVDSF